MLREKLIYTRRDLEIMNEFRNVHEELDRLYRDNCELKDRVYRLECRLNEEKPYNCATCESVR